MNRFRSKIIACFLLLVVIVFVLGLGIAKLREYKSQALSTIESSFNVKLAAGDVNFKLSAISFKDVEIIDHNGDNRQSYYAKNIDVNFSKISLLLFNPKISNIIIDNAEIELNQLPKYFESRYKFILNNVMIKNSGVFTDFYIPKLIYKPYSNSFKLTADISTINTLYHISISDNFKRNALKLDFASNDKNTEIAIDAKKGTISGHGNLLAIINDLTIFDTTTTTNNDCILSGNIDSKDNQTLVNFDIKSDAIDLHGDYASNKENFSITVESEKLNLDLIKIGSLSNIDYTQYLEKIIPKHTTGNININFKDINCNNQKINNFNLSAEITNSKLVLHNVNANLPGNSKLSLYGNIENQEQFSKFQGNFSIIGENTKDFFSWLNLKYNFDSSEKFKLNGKIFLAPQMFILDDFSLRSGDINLSSTFISKVFLIARR